jgi:hypothetical protein
MKLQLPFVLSFVLLSYCSFSATFYINTMYKASGNNYTITSQSYTNIAAINGTAFQFYQAGAQFSGNNVNGIFTYYNAAGILQTVYGTISRQDKTGNTSNTFNFLVSNANYSQYSGEAFLLVVPGRESHAFAGGTITTSSDPVSNALNALLAGQNAIVLSSNPSTNDQMICIGSSISLITYATTGATGGTVTGLPSGVTGTWLNNVVTISGTPTVSGTFHYTVHLTGGSGSGTASGTITIYSSPTITAINVEGTTAWVSFTPPVNIGTSTVINYAYSLDNGDSWQLRNPASTVSPLAINNIATNSTYQIKIRAVYDVGPTCASTASFASVIIVLPVTIFDMQVTKRQQAIVLDWKASLETNMDQYDIERSANGVNFENIGSKKANGSKTAIVDYRFLDSIPLVGDNFYRIKLIDKSGRCQYTDILFIHLRRNIVGISMYPNPTTTSGFMLNLQEMPADKYMVQMINKKGEKVFIKQINHNGGSSSIKMQLPEIFNAGVYLVRYLRNNKVLKTEQLLLE